MHLPDALSIVSSVCFLFGSVVLLQIPPWSLLSSPFFIVGSAACVIRQTIDDEIGVYTLGYFGYIFGSFFFITATGNAIILPVSCFVVGSVILLFHDAKRLHKPYSLFTVLLTVGESAFFLIGSVFLFPSVINNIAASVLFAVGSFISLLCSTAVLEQREQIELIILVILFVALQVLIVLDIKITPLYDSSVDTLTNYLISVGMLLSISSNIIQAVFTYHIKKASDFNSFSLVFWLLASFTWLVYNGLQQHYTMVLANIVSLLSSSVLIYFHQDLGGFFSTINVLTVLQGFSTFKRGFFSTFTHKFYL